MTALRVEGIIACAEACETAATRGGIWGIFNVAMSFCKGILSVEPYERGRGTASGFSAAVKSMASGNDTVYSRPAQLNNTID